MKKGWQTKKLGELLEVQNGYAFRSKDYSESGHFVMRIGNVQNGFISLVDPKFIKLPADGTLERFALAEGDILVSLTGNVGRVGVIKKEHLPAALNQRVARISIRRDSPATREYLLFFLFSDSFREELSGAGHGAAQQNVSTKDLVEIAVPVPSLAEQQRIVGLLDEAFEGLATAKANAAQNLQNARALFESHLQSVFTHRGKGWVAGTLGDVCEATQGVQIPKSEQLPEKRPGYRRYLYISDFESDKNLKFVRDEYPKKLVTTEDIIVANTGSAGKIFRGIDGILSNNLFRVTIDAARADRDFIFYFVTSGLFRDYQQSIMRGTANPHMGHVNFKSTPLNIPPVAEQESIVTQLDALAAETQRLTRLYEQKLAALEALKKSLLHQAFSGEL